MKLDLKRLMHNCFGIMMTRGILFSYDSLYRTLNSVSFYLKQVNKLSDAELHQALIWFFEDFNGGCNPPMTAEHIEKVMIPAVLNYADFDATIGTDILMSAIKAMALQDNTRKN